MSEDAKPPSLFAEILVAVLTFVSIAFMFVGIFGFFSKDSGQIFAAPVLVLGLLFTILFGVLWAKVSEQRKQAKHPGPIVKT